MPLLPKAKLAALAASARTDRAERDARGDFQRDERPLPTMGIHTMAIKSISAITTHKGGHQGIETVYEEPSGTTAAVKDMKILVSGGDYREDYLEKNWEYLAKRFVDEFDFELPEAETVEELAKKLQVFVGRSVKVAVQWSDSIWWNKKDGKYLLQTAAYAWYTGSTEKEMFYNAAKGRRGLSAADQAKVDAGTNATPPAGAATATEGGKTEEEKGDPYAPAAGNGVTPTWMRGGGAPQE